jgi:hypothetical protein
MVIFKPSVLPLHYLIKDNRTRSKNNVSTNVALQKACTIYKKIDILNTMRHFLSIQQHGPYQQLVWQDVRKMLPQISLVSERGPSKFKSGR